MVKYLFYLHILNAFNISEYLNYTENVISSLDNITNIISKTNYYKYISSYDVNRSCHIVMEICSEVKLGEARGRNEKNQASSCTLTLIQITFRAS